MSLKLKWRGRTMTINSSISRDGIVTRRSQRQGEHNWFGFEIHSDPLFMQVYQLLDQAVKQKGNDHEVEATVLLPVTIRVKHWPARKSKRPR